MQKEYTTGSCFTKFIEDISHIKLPDKFTYPFYYEPHALCVKAANQLQHLLLTQKKWHHDFGLDHFVEGSNIGKMFGVLVVQKKDGQLGFLSAFSGKLAETNHLPGFVPPIYDLLDKDGFFKIEEDQISKINHKIEALENDAAYLECEKININEIEKSEKELQEFRQFMKNAKNARKDRRNIGKHELSQTEFDKLAEELKQESLKQQYDYKQLKKQWQERITQNQNKLRIFTDKIDSLKEERKERSAALQQKLFDQYQFLNKDGETMGVSEIFANTSLNVPPAGAGDCAAPKLFQFAFQHKLKPIAMAEFWWGQSPKSEIRKHKNFYPSCRGKCEPILGHMLKGIPMDENPIQSPTIHEDELEIVFEDKDVLVVNKPAEFLSVPGKETGDSVFYRIQQKYPEATGPLLVHRLDMSTSGLILVAKNKEAHKILQKQFLDRTVQKRYVALLDGIIEQDQGLIKLPLRVDLDDRPRQLVCYEYGKRAITKFKVIERKDGKTKVHFFPITGRTHQLRVHAAHPQGLNMPIVGDDLYGIKSNRLYLHAEYLEFSHPVTNEKIKIKADADF
ncbi:MULTISPECIES: RluA family pseudouridine synthase [unclassified Saccharicrinis]|uniref:RluA family pseudouridine synthase n=1 Tax=unclassified Saccharicrinis TaxID=2646859 RepID=UPI003D32773C